MATPPFDQSVAFLYVTDMARSRAFYEGVLGLSPVLEQGDAVVIYAAAAGGRAFVGICKARGPRQLGDPRTPGGVVFTFVTPAVEAWHARAVAAGADVLGPPAFSQAHRITGFFLRDPDGTMLEIQRFEDPAWPMPG